MGRLWGLAVSASLFRRSTWTDDGIHENILRGEKYRSKYRFIIFLNTKYLPNND
jgi:hypothetical protein